MARRGYENLATNDPGFDNDLSTIDLSESLEPLDITMLSTELSYKAPPSENKTIGATGRMGPMPPAADLDLESGGQPGVTVGYPWTIAFYAPFFDVTTESVIQKLLLTVTPWKKESFFLNAAFQQPDMYGPVWIAVTLIFCIGVIGNLIAFLNHLLSGGVPSPNAPPDVSGLQLTMKEFNTEWTKMTAAAMIVCSFLGALPALLWGVVTYMGGKVNMLKLASCIGYSLFPLLPALIITPFLFFARGLQWVVILLAMGLGTYFSVNNIMSELKSQIPASKMLAVAGIIIASNALLAIGILVSL
eukprot:Platyproteum_vivax@DN3386_c0_g1_i1.p1